MKKNIIIFIFLSLINCQEGPKAALDENFVEANPKVVLPYPDLIGTYLLDEDSKKRFQLQDSIQMNLEIKKDTSVIFNNYISLDERSLLNKKLKSKIYYINDFTSIYLGLFNKEITTAGSLAIYYRKSDNKLALYAYIKPLQGQEHGDYLRYIKVKDSVK